MMCASDSAVHSQWKSALVPSVGNCQPLWWEANFRYCLFSLRHLPFMILYTDYIKLRTKCLCVTMTSTFSTVELGSSHVSLWVLVLEFHHFSSVQCPPSHDPAPVQVVEVGFVMQRPTDDTRNLETFRMAQGNFCVHGNDNETTW